MIIILKRILKSGWLSFKRQANLSFTAFLVLVIAVSSIGFLFLSHNILNFLIQDMEQRADISVYFKQESLEKDILNLEQELDNLSEVKSTEFVSEDQALEDFIQEHKEDESLMNSLIEVGINPFLSSLNIRANEMDNYQRIVDFLSNNRFSEIIEKIDYSRRKPVIKKIFNISRFIDKTGIILSVVLGISSVLVVSNTIKLAIYKQEEEIAVMRLVGAPNSFIRGPFLVQGAICGFLSSIISFVVVALSFYVLDSGMKVFFSGFQVFSFFRQNIWSLLLIQIVSGLILGIIPSMIAIRKYLKI